MNLQILSVRYGHATNSSSTHSIIYKPNHNRCTQNKDGTWKMRDKKSYEPFEFGWEYFICATEDSKRRYLAAQFMGSVSYKDNIQFAQAILKKLLDVDVPDNDKYGRCAGVDHQSQIQFPKEYGKDSIDLDFFIEFANYILHPDIAIFGGNDNELPEDMPDLSGKIKLPLELDYGGRWTCREDDIYNYWTLYNKDTGCRIRLRFVNNPPAIETIAYEKEKWIEEIKKED